MADIVVCPKEAILGVDHIAVDCALFTDIQCAGVSVTRSLAVQEAFVGQVTADFCFAQHQGGEVAHADDREAAGVKQVAVDCIAPVAI